MKLSEALNKKTSIEIYKNINTDEFTKWFKGSKIIDDKGHPISVFHGSPYNFDKFEDFEDNSLFFSGNKLDVDKYAGTNGVIYECYLKCRNPAIIVSQEKISSGIFDDSHKIGWDQSQWRKNCIKYDFDGIIWKRKFHDGDNFFVLSPIQVWIYKKYSLGKK